MVKTIEAVLFPKFIYKNFIRDCINCHFNIRPCLPLCGLLVGHSSYSKNMGLKVIQVMQAASRIKVGCWWLSTTKFLILVSEFYEAKEQLNPLL